MGGARRALRNHGGGHSGADRSGDGSGRAPHRASDAVAAKRAEEDHGLQGLEARRPLRAGLRREAAADEGSSSHPMA